jgi:hypothetical protein
LKFRISLRTIRGLNYYAGEKYFFRIGRTSSTDLDGIFTIKEFISKSNDSCCNSIELFEDQAQLFNNNNCTTDNIKISGDPITDDLWYHFTPSSTKKFEITTCGLDQNLFSKVVIYQTNNCGSIYSYSEIALSSHYNNCDFFGSTTYLTMDEGENYYLRLGSSGNSVGEGEIIIREMPVQANDTCEGAIQLNFGVSEEYDGGAYALSEETFVSCTDSTIFSDVWYYFEAEENNEYRISTCESSYGTKLAVYEGDNCNVISDFSDVFCSETSAFCSGSNRASLNFTANEGRYYIRVGSQDYHDFFQRGKIIVDYATSISEEINNDFTTVFPNPSNGNINIEFREDGKRALVLMDLTGKKHFEKKTKSKSEKIELENKLASGVYVLYITSENSAVSTKRVLIK